jgi:hypothetical protein
LKRQAAFGDGSMHALDFGYQTDLANCWANSFLLHKYFGKKEPFPDTSFDEPRGAKIFPYVKVGVFRTPDMVSSISWYGPRQAMMVVPNNAEALGEYPSLTAYRGNIIESQLSGLGYLTLAREKKPRRLRVDGEADVSEDHGALTVNFTRSIPQIAKQQIGYCALPSGEVIVSSKWEALEDINVALLADHTFYWLDIPGWLPTRTAKKQADGSWNIDDKLSMQIIGEASGEAVEGGLLAAVNRDFEAKKGDVLQDTVCVYQSILPDQPSSKISGDVNELQIGNTWTLRKEADGTLKLSPAKR